MDGVMVSSYCPLLTAQINMTKNRKATKKLTPISKNMMFIFPVFRLLSYHSVSKFRCIKMAYRTDACLISIIRYNRGG